MEIKVLEETKKKILIEVVGHGSAFCNTIKKELWNDKSVRAASFNLEHPLASNPKIIIETDGKTEPRKVLEKAIERLQKQSKEFKSSFVKEVR